MNAQKIEMHVFYHGKISQYNTIKKKKTPKNIN